MKKLIKEILKQVLFENEEYLPLSKDRFYYDKRRDKTFQIISVDQQKVIIEYFDYKTRLSTEETKVLDKEIVDYYISNKVWVEWKQPFRI